MAAQTIGGANNPSVVFTTSNPATYAAVKAIFDTAVASAYVPGGGTESGTFIADNSTSQTYSSASGTVVAVQSGAAQASFLDAFATNETVYVSDGLNSTVTNLNAAGTLTASFGNGEANASGYGGTNLFTTDAGGHNAITFTARSAGAQTNVLDSSGTDSVAISGPVAGGTQLNTVVVSAAGIDSVTLQAGATLAFSTAGTTASTISAGVGSSVSIAGAGSTSVTAGSGSETFSVDTAAGNVTLTGATVNGAADSFAFTHPAAGVADTGLAAETVNGFVAGDFITLAGYGTTPGAAYTVSGGTGGTVLSLSDGTKINFASVTDTSTVTSHITLK